MSHSLRTATPPDLSPVVAAATGRPSAPIASWSCAPLDHRLDNMTTESIDRFNGTLIDGTPWSVIAKTLRPASDSPAFAFIPPDHHADTLVALNWLDEPRIYRSALGNQFPDGFRMPVVYGTDESADRITIWMEDVADVTPWSLDRYRRTASALGELAGRVARSGATDELGLTTRDIGGMYFGKVVHFDLMVQADDQFWSDPDVARAVDADHRTDLFRAAERMPALIATLPELARGVCHGDAAPSNFREPGDGDIVGLDWSYCHVGELGSDLAQLLAGRFESGEVAAGREEIETTAALIFDGYAEGLANEGLLVDPAQIRRAFLTHLAIRSTFAALMIGERPDLDGAARLQSMKTRAALGRYGLDRVLELPVG